MRKLQSFCLAMLLLLPLSSCSKSVLDGESQTIPLPQNIGMQNWVNDQFVTANETDDLLYFRGTLYLLDPMVCYTYNRETAEISTIGFPPEYNTIDSFEALNVIDGEVYAVVGKNYHRFLINLTNPDAFEPVAFDKDIPSQTVMINDYVYYIERNNERKSELKAVNLNTRETVTMVAASDTFETNHFIYDDTYIYYQNNQQKYPNRVYRFPFAEPEKVEEFIVDLDENNKFKLKFIHEGQLYFETNNYKISLSARAPWNGEIEYIFEENSLVTNFMPFRDGFIGEMSTASTAHREAVYWLAFFDHDGNHVKNLTSKEDFMQNDQIYSYKFISMGDTAIIYLSGATERKKETFSKIVYIDEMGKSHTITPTIE